VSPPPPLPTPAPEPTGLVDRLADWVSALPDWLPETAAWAGVVVSVAAAFYTRSQARTARAALAETRKAREAAERAAEAGERQVAVGEASVQEARRQAEAAEASAQVARDDARDRAIERHDLAGPLFEVEEALVDDLTAEVRMRIVGGPGDLAVEVRPADLTMCPGLSVRPESDQAESQWLPPREPGDDIVLTAHLAFRPIRGQRTSLPLLVTATAATDPSQRWERRVAVPLALPPPSPRAVRISWGLGPLPERW
jgi:hypothetical protein